MCMDALVEEKGLQSFTRVKSLNITVEKYSVKSPTQSLLHKYGKVVIVISPVCRLACFMIRMKDGRTGGRKENVSSKTT